jgi:hypothetical protein
MKYLGNLIGSRTKNTGILLNTKSWLPSSVNNFTENPLTSLTQSAEPLPGPTVDILIRALHFLPMPFKKAADVRCDMS